MIGFPGSKINLGLAVVSKRPDNYHSLESVFIPISWSDILDIVKDSSIPDGHAAFSSSGIQIPGESSTNLCVKAFDILNQRFSLPGTKIHLHKVVPIGAGLGGGSADGAFTLKMLNTIYDLKLNSSQMEELALLLGSDCPFFIKNSAQYVTGRGESMESIDFKLNDHWVYLINPSIHISTQEAYSAITPAPSKHSIKSILNEPIATWKGSLVNDFELPMKHKFTIINDLINQLYSQEAEYAAMTGSGSTVFGIFKNRPSKLLAYSELEQWIGPI